MIVVGSKVRCKGNFIVRSERGEHPAPISRGIYTVERITLNGYSLDSGVEVRLKLEEFEIGQFNRDHFEEYEEPKEEINFKDDKIIFL